MRSRSARRLTAATPAVAASLEVPRSAPGRLRGHVDMVAIGKGFVHVQGWVCGLDGAQVTQPVTIGLCGQTFAGYGLSHRPDLESAGIAGGLAALNAVVPITSCPLEIGHEVVLTDANGSSCSLYCPAARVSFFVPSGFIDHVGSSSVTGWVFDPGASNSDGGRLLLDEDWVANIDNTLERYDLTFDVGDGQRAFGFECATDVISEAIRRRPYIKDGNATLGLASSGWLVAALKIRLLDDKLVPAAPEPAPPRRILASDCLIDIAALQIDQPQVALATIQKAAI